MVQRHERLRLHRADRGSGKDVFVHISAVERSGLTGLKDNQKSASTSSPAGTGVTRAVNLKAL
jgi:CspA family cold shock protein